MNWRAKGMMVVFGGDTAGKLCQTTVRVPVMCLFFHPNVTFKASKMAHDQTFIRISGQAVKNGLSDMVGSIS